MHSPLSRTPRSTRSEPPKILPASTPTAATPTLPSRDPGRGADCCHYPHSRWGPGVPWQPCLLPSTLPPAPAGNHSRSLRAADNGHPAPSCLHPTTRELSPCLLLPRPRSAPTPCTTAAPGLSVTLHRAGGSHQQRSSCPRTHQQLLRMGTMLPSVPACSWHTMQTHVLCVLATWIWRENPRAEWGRRGWHEMVI